MALACLASFAILAGGLSLIYGLGWYKDRKFKRRITRRVKAIDYPPEQTATNQPDNPLTN